MFKRPPFSIICYIFQSQEVTYAELSLPRNKGYAPMRTMPTSNLGGGHCNNITPTPVLASMDPSCSSSMASTGSDRGGSTGAGQPPVIYARVDHAAKRNNTNLCMLNQAQTTVPLLISNISGGSVTSAGGQPVSLSGGGGVSPSSIMNTSCESSTSSGSASRLVFLFFLARLYPKY